MRSQESEGTERCPQGGTSPDHQVLPVHLAPGKHNIKGYGRITSNFQGDTNIQNTTAGLTLSFAFQCLQVGSFLISDILLHVWVDFYTTEDHFSRKTGENSLDKSLSVL